jgi:hypothetical protein
MTHSHLPPTSSARDESTAERVARVRRLAQAVRDGTYRPDLVGTARRMIECGGLLDPIAEEDRGEPV